MGGKRSFIEGCSGDEDAPSSVITVVEEARKSDPVDRNRGTVWQGGPLGCRPRKQGGALS
jgi:hypothetical protein